MTVINANCLDWMRTQSDNSIDCIITDPPYGLKFMSKKWDYELPSIEIWQESLRICKPGSWLLAFGGSRTYHRLTCSIEDAGWEIRDCILYMHGQGFPKGKGCLKPAYEPIILARKRAPKPELNIDDCRIGLPENKRAAGTRTYKAGTLAGGLNGLGELQDAPHDGLGRWPANVILDEVAAEMLDQQTGILNPPGNKKKSNGNAIFGANISTKNEPGVNCYPGEFGVGASRFFYCAKASTSERNRGCVNGHPCVKPQKLMEYLIKLVAPKNGVILDPFCGSGSTLVAAKKLGYKVTGIELDSEYCKIAEARIAAQECQMELDL